MPPSDPIAPGDDWCESAKYGVSWQFTHATFLISITLPDGPATVMPSATSLSKNNIWPSLAIVSFWSSSLYGLWGGAPLSGSSALIFFHSSSVKSSLVESHAVTSELIIAAAQRIVVKRMLFLLSSKLG